MTGVWSGGGSLLVSVGWYGGGGGHNEAWGATLLGRHCLAQAGASGCMARYWPLTLMAIVCAGTRIAFPHIGDPSDPGCLQRLLRWRRARDHVRSAHAHAKSQ